MILIRKHIEIIPYLSKNFLIDQIVARYYLEGVPSADYIYYDFFIVLHC